MAMNTQEMTEDILATREEMIEEAIQRLEMLDLHEAVLRLFKKNHQLFYSERCGLKLLGKTMPVGVLYWIDNKKEFSQMVKAFEEKSGGVVYHATYEELEFGRCLDLFFVSPYKDEWERDRIELENGYSCAYVKNLDDDFCSEYGMIRFQECGGGLIRTA